MAFPFRVMPSQAPDELSVRITICGMPSQAPIDRSQALAFYGKSPDCPSQAPDGIEI